MCPQARRTTWKAGAQSEPDGAAPASRGPVFKDGWDEGVTIVSQTGLASTRIRTGVSASGRTRVRCPGPLDDA